MRPTTLSTKQRPTQTLRDEFETLGFLGPVRVWDERTCRAARKLIRQAPPPADWTKGHAVTSRLFHALGTHPAILDRVAALLGEDVMLWGAHIARRNPGQIHPWHTDMESSSREGRTVSVWVGLEHTSRHSSLRVITRSHRLGVTIQECAHDEGRERDDTAADDAVRWAQGRDPESVLVTPDMSDGEAIFFDGRLWHGTDNTGTEPRTAILLQYAAPDTPIRMPFRATYTWPFRFHETPPYPPCIMARGTDRSGVNRIVPAPRPAEGGRPALSSRVEPVTLPLQENAEPAGSRTLSFAAPHPR